MSKEWDGVERRKRWGSDYPNNTECPIDPECFYRTKQQVEINTKRIEIIDAELRAFMDAKLVEEVAVRGGKATLWVASAILLTSMTIVISLVIAVLSGKLTIAEFLKIVF